MSDVVEIYDARDELEATLLCHVLEEAGIAAWTAGESLGAVHGGGFVGQMNRVTVAVNSVDAQRARLTIDEWSTRSNVAENHEQRSSTQRILIVGALMMVIAFALIVLLTGGPLQATLLAALFWIPATVAAVTVVLRRRR